MDKITTTTIKREWLREIVAGRKRVEHRADQTLLDKEVRRCVASVHAGLINGMQAKAPELTVVVRGIRTNRRTGNYELQLGKLAEVKH